MRGGRALRTRSSWRLATYFADDAPDDGWTRMGRGMMTTFAEDWQDEASAKAAYLAHNELVRETAPRDRLLEWRPEEGWEPICARPAARRPRRAVSPHQHLGASSRRIGSRPPVAGSRPCTGPGYCFGTTGLQPSSSRSANRRPRPCLIASATQSWNNASMSRFLVLSDVDRAEAHTFDDGLDGGTIALRRGEEHVGTLAVEHGVRHVLPPSVLKARA